MDVRRTRLWVEYTGLIRKGGGQRVQDPREGHLVQFPVQLIRVLFLVDPLHAVQLNAPGAGKGEHKVLLVHHIRYTGECCGNRRVLDSILIRASIQQAVKEAVQTIVRSQEEEESKVKVLEEDDREFTPVPSKLLRLAGQEVGQGEQETESRRPFHFR